MLLNTVNDSVNTQLFLTNLTVWLKKLVSNQRPFRQNKNEGWEWVYKNTPNTNNDYFFIITDQYGSNNYEAAVCDMMVDSQEEIVNAIIKLMSTCKTEEEKVFTIHQPNNDNNTLLRALSADIRVLPSHCYSLVMQ